MDLAFDIGETWGRAPRELFADLSAFLCDAADDIAAPPQPRFVAANDNALLLDGERPHARWEPRFRTAD